MKKYIIREIPAEQADFSIYFDDDGLTEAGGDYCYNLFIVGNRNISGFNTEAYEVAKTDIENLLEMYLDIVNKSDYAEYTSIGAMLFDCDLIKSIHNTKKIKAYIDFFETCNKNFAEVEADTVAEYLTIKTGKEWDTDSATGYCQGDYVKMVYCKEHYTEGVMQYGEIWLGAGKEFTITFLNGNGEEEDNVGGYIVADCQAWEDEDCKKLVCEWEGIDEAEAELQMVDGQHTTINYSYRTV